MFFTIGLGGLILGNCLIANIDFFESRFKPDYDPKFILMFVYCWPLFFGNFLLLYLSKRVSLKVRLNTSFIVVFITALATVLGTEFFSITLAWYSIMICVFFLGLANSFVMGGLFGFASMFPPKFMILLLMSQTLAGIVVNFVKMLWVFILPPDNSKGKEDINTFYNSLIVIMFGACLWVACIVCFNFIFHMQYVQYFLQKAESSDSSQLSQNSSAQNIGVDDESHFRGTCSFSLTWIL